MVTNLKSLIIHQIKDVFNNIKVYDEPIKQGLKTPAFQLLVINNQNKRLLGKSSSRTYTINVNYYPNTDDIRNECDKVLETFQNEFIYIANKFHVHEIEGEIMDNVLVITFNVKPLLRSVEEEIKMQDLGVVNIDEKD